MFQPRFMRLSSLSFRLMCPADDGQDPGGSGGSGDQGSGGQGDQNKGEKDDKKEGSGGQKFDITTLPKEAQDLIKSLRDENAKTRTGKNNLASRLEKFEKIFKELSGDEGDSEEPEAKIGKLTGTVEQLQIQNQLLTLAYQNGISPDDLEYFEFSMKKKLDSLEEGQEFGEGDLEEILSKFKKAPRKAADSSVKEDGKGAKPPGSGEGEVTAEQFAKMTMLQKSDLYNRKPEVYNALMAGSRGK